MRPARLPVDPPQTESVEVMVELGTGFTVTVVVEGADAPQTVVRVTV